MHESDPFFWRDTKGKIVGLNASATTIKISLNETVKNKFVVLKIVPTTVLSREIEVPAPQLHVGDKVLWFSHLAYAVATGKERRHVSRFFGASAPSDFYPKGANYPLSFSMYMDRRIPAVVSTLNPVRITIARWNSETSSLSFPIDESDFYRKKYGAAGILEIPKPEDHDSQGNVNKPNVFTFLDDKGASFGIYNVLKFSDLAVGQAVRFIVSKRIVNQAERISVTSFPS